MCFLPLLTDPVAFSVVTMLEFLLHSNAVKNIGIQYHRGKHWEHILSVFYEKINTKGLCCVVKDNRTSHTHIRTYICICMRVCVCVWGLCLLSSYIKSKYLYNASYTCRGYHT